MNTFTKLAIASIGLCSLMLSTGASAQNYEQNGDAQIGSKMKTRKPKTDFPHDKHYSEFTDKEKRAYRRPYEGIPDTETPPYPEKNMSWISWEISRLAKERVRNWPRGKMFAIVDVSAKGVAKKVTIYEAPNGESAQLTSYVLTQTKFTPADCNGTPCDGEFLWQAEYKDLEFRTGSR